MLAIAARSPAQESTSLKGMTMLLFNREVSLNVYGQNTRVLLVSKGTLGEMLAAVADRLKREGNRPFTVEVRVNGQIRHQTPENRNSRPGWTSVTELTQYCGKECFTVNSPVWRLDYPK